MLEINCKSKLSEYIKFGIGFYIGYETAKTLNDILGEVMKVVGKRVKDGSC